ncbi:MAG: glycine zipper 2TM domain-containing protein [Hyphomonadaceae bacterium]|nr:glycine zipper 2TM domain-containing protein [Hyphomonadaceae bacterium]
MANIPLIAAGVAGALAVAGVSFAVGAANPPPSAIERVEDESGKPVKLASVDDSNERIAAAESRAAAAERAAEAKIQCERDRQRASNQGAIVGGVAGGVIGSQVAGSGAKSEGAVIGGLGGVLAGRQIAKKDHRC